MKAALQNLATTVVALLLVAGLAEGALRFLPVAEGMNVEPVNAENPVYHFKPNQDLVWSRGLLFDLVNRIRINDVGFVNDQDYGNGDGKPALAVVGDSQVEAAMVPYRQTVHSRIAQITGRKVYSFAASGAPLSQYLVWAGYARRHWDPDQLAIVILGNDFDESVLRFKSSPGFHYYREDPDGELRLVRIDYHRSPVRDLAKTSALVRYLVINGHIIERLSRIGRVLAGAAHAAEEEYAGNTSISTDPERLRLSKRAVDAFLADLTEVAGWPSDKVVLVVDGFRYPPDRARAAESYFGQMRRYLMQMASQRGFRVVDLDEFFFADFEAHGQPFEFPTDGHWNSRAHDIAARAVAGVLGAN